MRSFYNSFEPYNNSDAWVLKEIKQLLRTHGFTEGCLVKHRLQTQRLVYPDIVEKERNPHGPFFFAKKVDLTGQISTYLGVKRVGPIFHNMEIAGKLYRADLHSFVISLLHGHQEVFLLVNPGSAVSTAIKFLEPLVETENASKETETQGP